MIALAPASGLDRCPLVARDPATDVVLLPIPADYGPITDRSADDMVALAPDSPALLLPVWMSGHRAAGYATLNAAGLAPFRSLGKAVTALKRLIWRGDWSPSGTKRRGSSYLASTHAAIRCTRTLWVYSEK